MSTTQYINDNAPLHVNKCKANKFNLFKILILQKKECRSVYDLGKKRKNTSVNISWPLQNSIIDLNKAKYTIEKVQWVKF